MMGGIDGYFAVTERPKQAFEFLEFLVTPDQQKLYSRHSSPSRSTGPRSRS